MDKNVSALDVLEQKHIKDTAARASRIDAAMKDVRAAETMLRESRDRVRQLQTDNINASFAYDAECARLQTEDRVAA